MKYPIKRRIWYNCQRFDMINTDESLPYVIPSITGNDAFYRIKTDAVPFGVSVVINDMITHVTNVRSIWVSPNANAICLSHGDTICYPKDTYYASNCLIDISNKFVHITEHEEGTRICIYPLPDFQDITDDTELDYPYSWTVPFRNSAAGSDSNDEITPLQYIQYKHDNPLNPPYPVNIDELS